jgi:hypothetical protein
MNKMKVRTMVQELERLKFLSDCRKEFAIGAMALNVRKLGYSESEAERF